MRKTQRVTTSSKIFTAYLTYKADIFSERAHIHAFGNCDNFGGKNMCALRLSAKSHLRELIKPAIFRHGSLVTLHFFTSADVRTLGRRTCAFDWFIRIGSCSGSLMKI